MSFVLLVYKRSRNCTIELYKGDLVHALCSIMISSDRRTMAFTMDLVMSNYGHSHNLDGHNALLEVAYDRWA